MNVRFFDFRNKNYDDWNGEPLDFFEALNKIHEMAAIAWDRDGFDLDPDCKYTVSTWKLTPLRGYGVVVKNERLDPYSPCQWTVLSNDLIWLPESHWRENYKIFTLAKIDLPA